MKKIIAIIAIVMCFSVFAVSCANQQGNAESTTEAVTKSGDGELDWGDLVDQTTAGPDATTAAGQTTQATTISTNHPQSWENAGVDTEDRWGVLNTGYN